MYGWGTNENWMLGFPNKGDVIWEPTLIEYFKDYTVEKAVCSLTHTIFKARRNDIPDSPFEIIVAGRPDDLNYVGVTADEGNGNEKYMWHLDKYKGLQIEQIASG